MSNMNIYKAIRIGIFVMIVTSLLSSNANNFLGEGTASSLIVIVSGVVSFGWTIFMLYKMWSVREVNSGFRQYALMGIAVNVIGMLLAILSVIFIIFAGITAAILLGLNQGGLSGLGMGYIIYFVLMGIAFVLMLYLTFKSYSGLYDGTEELLYSNPETVDSVKRANILEMLPKIRKITKKLFVYLPIFSLAVLILIVLLLYLQSSIGAFILVAGLIVIMIVSIVMGIIFYSRLYKFCSISEKAFDNPRYWMD